MNQLEKTLQKEICLKLNMAFIKVGWFMVTNVTGTPISTINGIKFRPNNMKGMSDIIGLIFGRFVAIEVKRTSKLRPTFYQQEFLNQIARHGGVAIVTSNYEDAYLKIMKILNKTE